MVISRRGEELLCQCSDTGFGIQSQKQIFTNFRADNILHVDTDGTGLGLYLAKAIVESMEVVKFGLKLKQGMTFLVLHCQLLACSPNKAKSRSTDKNYV